MIGLEFKKLKLPKSFKVQEMAETIARVLEKLQGNDRLDYEALKNRPSVTSYRTKFGSRGGSGGGGGINELTATGLVDGINMIFRFSDEPRYIVADNMWYKKGAGWTWSYPNATMTNPPSVSIFGIG